MTEEKRLHRFHGYDYSRGAVLFITFTLEKRIPIFGKITGDKVEYSQVGLALLDTIQKEMKRNPNLVVHKFVIMPDHVHIRIYIQPNTPKPLVAVGQFVNNIKRWSKWKANNLGTHFEWQQNYHDRLCISADIIDLVDKYISNNPLKWSLMHGDNPPLKVFEPIISERVPDTEWWTGVGNIDLISDNAKLAAFKLSRSIPTSEFSSVVNRCLGAVAKGYIPVSTFISPCELELKQALIAAKAPMIRAVPDALATVYRPKADEPQQFSDGKLLLLSRVAAQNVSRSQVWHSINDSLADIASANGEAVYVVKGAEGKLEWRFHRHRNQ